MSIAILRMTMANPPVDKSIRFGRSQHRSLARDNKRRRPSCPDQGIRSRANRREDIIAASTPDKSRYRTNKVLLHLSGYRVISNDADRFKRFYFLFFLSTNTPFPWHANRVSVAALFHLCHPNSLGPFPLHRFGVAHQTSLRSRSTMMSYAISPQGGGSPNQSDGDDSHHNAV